jgi:hypothetical protein
MQLIGVSVNTSAEGLTTAPPAENNAGRTVGELTSSRHSDMSSASRHHADTVQ